MFEQSIVNAKPPKRTWSLVLSLVTQTALILLAAIIPLIYTDQLPGLSKWAQKLVSPSPPPAAKLETETQVATRPAASVPRVFIAPTTIPKRVADVHDDLSQRLPEPGVAGSIEPPSLASSVSQLLTMITPPPKPPAPPAPVHPPAASEPIRVSQGVQEAKLLRRIMPVYPPLAITTRTQGTVHLVGVIAKDGTIRDLQVIDGHPLLVRSAVDAVKQWIYKPTLLSGEPVEVIAPIAVTFTLNR